MEDIEYSKMHGFRSAILCYDDWITAYRFLELCDRISQMDPTDTKIAKSDNYKNELRECILKFQECHIDLTEQLSELVSNPDDFLVDIPSLKKRIKYCKNFLERKVLEKQLNASYKAMKKRR